MHRSDAIGRFMNTTYGQSQDKTNVKVWTNRDVLYSLLAEHIVGPKKFSKSHFYFKICCDLFASFDNLEVECCHEASKSKKYWSEVYERTVTLRDPTYFSI